MTYEQDSIGINVFFPAFFQGITLFCLFLMCCDLVCTSLISIRKDVICRFIIATTDN